MSTTTHPETTIEAVPDQPVVVITREFDAPPEKVFRAHVDPDLIAQWLGPRSITTRLDHWDAQRGGSYRYVAESGGEEYRFYGSFHEVRPHERIVQTFTWEGVPDGVSLETAVFTDLGNGRTRLNATSVFDSIEGRDGMLSSGMDVGVSEGYEKLDELLAAG
jgi:uncharacterized protein YndB with AHSA1/START domain